MYEDIAINASKLTGTEKERYLQAQMQQIVRAASEAFIAFLTLYVRESPVWRQERNSTKFLTTLVRSAS